MALRYLAMEGAKFIPGPGWVVSAAISALGTWAIGQVAIQYFEHGKKLSDQQLQGLYRQRLGRGSNGSGAKRRRRGGQREHG
jgi:uncharacterized protein (DUF697 family)